MKSISRTNTHTLNKKVYVGMSGGVDSSVSAALLKEAGYNVTGVFIKVWQPDWSGMERICTWKDDRLDAMRVAAKLDIPFITLDLEDEYKREVVDYMIKEYREGRTPNPDIMCNQYVKFGGFFNWAMKQGADYVATGHYAQIVHEDSVYKLKAGEDANKDQSYFLWTLTQNQLSKTLFPVGNIEKPEVRKLASKYQLPNADKKDSQGLCFIGKVDIKDFLSHYIPLKKGDVLNEQGEVIGYHDGAEFFTIGERHGFTITEKTPHDEPYYVLSKNIQKNEIVVTHKTKEGAMPVTYTRVLLTDINWNQGIKPETALCGRSRYREALQALKLISDTEVSFETPQGTLTEGQSLVIYDTHGICYGGGIISAVLQ